MKRPVLIAGAGLSGLAAAWHLHQRGIEFKLIEARDRLGGRGLTVASTLGAFDLGPSWVWHGQPHVAQLLKRFSIASYDQYCDGVLLHQTADGAVHQNPYLKPMQNAQRVDGGIAALVNALAADLPSDNITMSCQLQSLEKTSSGVKANLSMSDGVVKDFFSNVAIAFPPRLAADLVISPELPISARNYLQNTPTWMAAQAKFFAVYDKPFWRNAGFSGDAFSATGVLAEIHDACMPGLSKNTKPDTVFYALFGFVRLPANTRAQMGEQSIVDAALQQLQQLFGDESLLPIKTYLKDWSEDPLTGAVADKAPLSHHPQYGACPEVGDPWQNSLNFIGAETATGSGGLIEGALQRGAEFAASVD